MSEYINDKKCPKCKKQTYYGINNRTYFKDKVEDKRWEVGGLTVPTIRTNAVTKKKEKRFSEYHDKYGKKIYEDDVICLSCGCCRYQVMYDESKKKFWLKDDGLSQVDGVDVDVWKCEVEIIGNVKKNPELMDGEIGAVEYSLIGIND